MTHLRDRDIRAAERFPAVLAALDVYKRQTHILQQGLTIHVLNTAICMSNDQNFLNTQLINSNQKTSHHAAKRVCDNSTGILNNLSIAVADSQRGRQQFSCGCKPQGQ